MRRVPLVLNTVTCLVVDGGTIGIRTRVRLRDKRANGRSGKMANRSPGDWARLDARLRSLGRCMDVVNAGVRGLTMFLLGPACSPHACVIALSKFLTCAHQAADVQMSSPGCDRSRCVTAFERDLAIKSSATADPQ